MNILQTIEPCKSFSAILDGKNAINGFKNKVIREKLYQARPEDKKNKYCTIITRLLRKLRAHGLITKIEGSSRYCY